jgi:hemolysin type calcium-binding protein
MPQWSREQRCSWLWRSRTGVGTDRTADSTDAPRLRSGRRAAPHNLLSISPNDLKPASCAGITVTTLLTGTGAFSGTAASELVLGGSGVDTITAGGGDDCILGGGGNDSIQGQSGTDVCIGGPGFDTFGVIGLGGCDTEIQ